MSLSFRLEATARGILRESKNPSAFKRMRQIDGRPFILPSVGRSSSLPSPHIQTCSLARHTPIGPKAALGLGPCTHRRANSPSDCGTRPVQSAADAATSRCFDTPSDDGGGTVGLSLLRAGNNAASVKERKFTVMMLPGAGPPSRSDGVIAAT